MSSASRDLHLQDKWGIPMLYCAVEAVAHLVPAQVPLRVNITTQMLLPTMSDFLSRTSDQPLELHQKNVWVHRPIATGCS